MTMTGLSITVLDHILLYSIAYFVKVTVLNFIVCFSKENREVGKGARGEIQRNRRAERHHGRDL